MLQIVTLYSSFSIQNSQKSTVKEKKSYLVLQILRLIDVYVI